MNTKTELGISRSTSSDCLSVRTKQGALDENEELSRKLSVADSHSDTNVANLIEFDDTVDVDTSSKQVSLICVTLSHKNILPNISIL